MFSFFYLVSRRLSAGLERSVVALCVGRGHKGHSFLPCVILLAACTISTLSANPFPAGAIFSNAHEDNDNPYDAPVPGYVGPDGEGVSNPNGNAGLSPWRPPATHGERNYVNPLFLGWADTVVKYAEASNVGHPWWFSGEALGPVSAQMLSVVSLGELTEQDFLEGKRPGELIVSFSKPIYDAPGADIVVFENGFLSEHTTDEGSINGEMAGELAYVEVSSDGETFLRFPSISRTPNFVGAYGTIRPRNVYNLVGKHSNAYGKSWGTPFDLAELRGLPGTGPGGAVDLDNIRYVRIVDIPGRGDFLDSQGHPIYDMWPTWGSGGADIDAIGAISQPHFYEDWQAQQNRPRPVDDPETFLPIGAAQEDFDGDGISNLLEYMLALDPRVAEPSDQLQFRYDPLLGQVHLSFRRDVRVADYCLIVERASSENFPLQWEPLLILGPLNDVFAAADVLEVDSVSLLPQASLGVIRRYAVTAVARAPQGGGGEFFRLRAEPLFE